VPDRFTSIVDAHVILRRNGKILLLRRAGNVYASGQLCLPSGHLEEGENILQTAVRETREETGIALDAATLRFVLSIHQRNPGTTHTRLGFVFEAESWRGEPVNSGKHSARSHVVMGSAGFGWRYGENAFAGGRQGVPSMRSSRTSMAFLPCLRAVSM
jgi:8-oxo-dGTP pyrophosphatase MutT (NUDIX family)